MDLSNESYSVSKSYKEEEIVKCSFLESMNLTAKDLLHPPSECVVSNHIDNLNVETNAQRRKASSEKREKKLQKDELVWNDEELVPKERTRKNCNVN